ncbi:2Fe-2S ferredoxin-type iron-sulfur binding domain, partial [Trinorchestia longiramus]
QSGKIIPVVGKIGETLLQVARNYKIDLEGACEGSLACSTCHVYADPRLFKFSMPTDREYDYIDLAYSPRDNSRLGCQVSVDKRIEGMVFEIPRATRNLTVDGYVPKPH